MTRRGSSRAERERRAGRVRRSAAIAVVGALAIGWFVTARIGNGDALAQGGGPAPVAASTVGVPRRDDALRAVVPVAAQCRDQDLSRRSVRCVLAGVAVEYRRVRTRDIEPEYGAAVGEPTAKPGVQGAPVCARGGEEERAWSRPAAPRVVAGRYACRVERGRAALWWTVDDRGLLAHATAGNGDLASLFAWWASHSER